MSEANPDRPRQRAQGLPMRRPLLSVTLSFGFGIVLGDRLGWPAWAGLGLCLAAVCVALLLLALDRAGPLRILPWMLAFFAAGLVRSPDPAPPAAGLPTGAVAAVIRAESGFRLSGPRRMLDGWLLGYHRPGGDWAPLTGRITLTVLEDETAGECPAVRPGQTIRAMTGLRRPRHRRNPGRPDPAQVQARQGVLLGGLVTSCDQVLVELGSGSPSLSGVAERGRQALRRAIAARAASRDARAVLTALTIGDAGGVRPETRTHFAQSGLAHILAVSGLHLGFVALGLYALLLWIGRRLGPLAASVDPRRVAALTVIPVTVGYAALAGARLPTLRAAVVVICFLVAVLLRRRSDPLQTLAAAGLIVLGLWPASIFDVSFQLSFVAAGAVLLLTPRLCVLFRVPLRQADMPAGWWRRVGWRAAQLGLVSLAAVLGTAPLTAAHFNQTSLGGLVANLLAVPLAAWLILPLGLLAALALIFSSALAGWILDLALAPSEWLVDLARTVSQVPGSHWAVGAPSAPQLVAWYGGLALFFFGRGPKRRLLAAACVLLFIGSWVYGRISPLWSDDLRLTCLDVGQGDSILVQLPGGDSLLIDGGPARPGGFDTGRRVIAPVLWNLGIHRLRAVVVSHRHPDHLGGLAAVVDLFEPDEVFTPAPLAEAEDAQALLSAMQRVGARERVVGAGAELLPAGSAVRLRVLWPRPDAGDLEENERSLVLRLEFGQRSVLLTGDLERIGEQALLAGGALAPVDVLKVGHHGSRFASSAGFLEVLHPAEAVISVGAQNPYGLPHPDTIQRLTAAGVRVWRTDVNGAVSVLSDGVDLRVSAEADDQKLPIRPKAAPLAEPLPSGE